MRRRVRSAVGSFSFLLLLTACTAQPITANPRPSPATIPVVPGAFDLIGHEPLLARGMNAGLAVHGGYAYVGRRIEGSTRHRGVLVVDVKDPADPAVVGAIGPPVRGAPGETSRELRIWPDQDLLIVLSFARVTGPTVRFYDIGGRRSRDPALISTYRPSLPPHEFYLWIDPRRPERAVLYLSVAERFGDQLLITDISGARESRFRELARWHALFPDPGPNDALHSLSVSPAGTRAYLAYLTAGFFVLDTSDVARNERHPRPRPQTPVVDRLQWDGWGAHSAIRLPGREIVLTTDEVYGSREAGGGCPWGWVRLIDTSDETSPRILSEYRALPFNDQARCGQIDADTDRDASFSSHDPTATTNLAFVTWHSAGLHAFTTDDPTDPQPAAIFVPEPLDDVTVEDPLLSSGPQKVVMWSYPIIQDGLIFVVDLRNGLYVLRYQGPFEDEVSAISFLEGNSNLGDALRLDER
jgi:hypothetical protein